MAAAVPLPGVAIVVRAGDAVKAATSTDTDGTYRLNVPPGAYDVTAELMGFDTTARTLNVPQEAVAQSCVQSIDFPMALAPRTPRAASAPAAPVPGAGAAPQQGRGAVPGAPAAQRFATLNVQTQAAAAAGIEEAPDSAARLLLPPGFSTEGPTQALAVNGNMASLDRGMLNDRLDAIGRGEFDPATGEFSQGFGPGGPGGRGGFGGCQQATGPGNRFKAGGGVWPAPYPFHRAIGIMHSIPTSSANCASLTLFSQLASQRSASVA